MVPRTDDTRPGVRFGIIGLGRFGRFMAEHLSSKATVLAFDRNPDTFESPIGSVIRAELPEVCSCRVVLLAIPIRALEECLLEIAPLLPPGTILVDTSSVKVWPLRWMEAHLPDSIELIGTHPLFGPDSAADGLGGKKIVFVPARTTHGDQARTFMSSLGMEVLEVSADEHDRQMAQTQALTHWVGRALERVDAGPREIDTLGYRRLLEILSYVSQDSWELFEDLERWNPYAKSVREQFLAALGDLHSEVEPV